MNVVHLFWTMSGAWLSVPVLFAAEALLPSEIARHLEERGSLAYSALFVACLAIGLSVWLVKVILQQHVDARKDYVDAMQKVGRLADELGNTPCQLVQRGLADVVVRDSSKTDQNQRLSIGSKIRESNG